MSANWLKDAIFYEVYPQSFRDTNDDGIGDLPGIIEKLPYIKELGCNGIWINPCFDSPFQDAGYDVRDYKKIASRYGTNEDMVQLFQEAHKLGIKVLLDLVPGHTSEEHPWFQESAKAEENEYSHRYIWTKMALARPKNYPFVAGEYPRDGAYIINFFKCQPALNYGFWNCENSWNHAIDDPAPMATREAMKDIMRFWLDMGCDGFRIDMAESLVKNDPDHEGTKIVWRDILGTIHAEYPECAIVAEWGVPTESLDCGFDMDFVLDWNSTVSQVMMRNYIQDRKTKEIIENHSYFTKGSNADATAFLKEFLPQYEAVQGKGLWCFITSNHDHVRPSAGLTELERKLAFSWIFTMPGVPFLYYGDEIGMDYRNLPTKEGGYHRTGSRTPMQWDDSKNLGFSDAPAEKLYLPVEDHASHTVSAQEGVKVSLLETVRELIKLRHQEEELQSYSRFAVYQAESGSRLFAYKRGENILVATNPGSGTECCQLDGDYKILYTIGEPVVEGKTLKMPAQSFVVLKK